MNKEFVPYKESLELKELGFNEPCFKNYNGNATLLDLSESIIYKTKAATFSQAFRWFREKYNLPSTIMYRKNIDDGTITYDWLILGQDVKYRHYVTYEKAELACLRRLLEIVKIIYDDK